MLYMIYIYYTVFIIYIYHLYLSCIFMAQAKISGLNFRWRLEPEPGSKE